MTQALATMRVDYDTVTQLKKLDTSKNSLLEKRRKSRTVTLLS